MEIGKKRINSIFSALIISTVFWSLTACDGSSSKNTSTPVIGDDSMILSDQLDMSPVAVEDQDTGLPEEWYRKGVFLEIFVRSYFDSNGDGYGDFDGLTQKLDYIEALGVKGIWLMPMMESQDKDHGYAVMDYRSYESDYGDATSFKTFLDAAHARGIGVIIDYVMNHSAAQNPLFQDSIYSLADKRDWYIWRDNYVYWPQPWGTGGDTWHAANNAYYYGIFWEQMPDFNLQNPAVLDYHANSLRYWLNLGVDGFRFDAVAHLVEDDDGLLSGHPETNQILKDVQNNIKQYHNRFMVCEAPGYSNVMAADDVCGSAFGFGLNYSLVNSARIGQVDTDLDYYLNESNLANTALVLANHDRFAGSRLFEQFNGDIARYKLAVASLMTLPGIPFIYYGEEVGMGHNGLGNDFDLRAPMSWTAESGTAGFTTGTVYRSLASNSSEYNVATQLDGPDSLLNFYKAMIHLRNQEVALQTGDFTRLNSTNKNVLSYLRSQDNKQVLVLINYSDSNIDITLPLKANSQWSGLYPDNIQNVQVDASGQTKLTIPALSVQVLSLL